MVSLYTCIYMYTLTMNGIPLGSNTVAGVAISFPLFGILVRPPLIPFPPELGLFLEGVVGVDLC